MDTPARGSKNLNETSYGTSVSAALQQTGRGVYDLATNSHYTVRKLEHHARTHCRTSRTPTLVGVLACALLLFTLAAPARTISAGVHADGVVARTNAVRAQEGVVPLRADASLTAAAQDRAEGIVRSGVFSHVQADGTPFSHAAQEHGYAFAHLGENLAINLLSEEPLITAWNESPTHRQNLLGAHYRDVGVGIASGYVDGVPTMVVVELFGSLQDPLLRDWERLPASIPMA
ncbi:MAG: CAP domain-containing protein [bacterium]|nr:CAP domain-containing protein [bacterium]